MRSAQFRPLFERVRWRSLLGHGRQAQRLRGSVQRGQHGLRRLQIQRHCPVLFAELFAIRAQHKVRVQVLRGGQLQSELQHDLPRGVIGQVLAAHDMGDALRGVVYHHCQLVSPEAVGAAQNKVAHFFAHVL